MYTHTHTHTHTAVSHELRGRIPQTMHKRKHSWKKETCQLPNADPSLPRLGRESASPFPPRQRHLCISPWFIQEPSSPGSRGQGCWSPLLGGANWPGPSGGLERQGPLISVLLSGPTGRLLGQLTCVSWGLGTPGPYQQVRPGCDVESQD